MAEKNDYLELKFGLEILAIDDKIPIEHHEALTNCETNKDGDVVMDVSNYSEDSIEAIQEEIELNIEKLDKNNLLIKGDFGKGPDTAPY